MIAVQLSELGDIAKVSLALFGDVEVNKIRVMYKTIESTVASPMTEKEIIATTFKVIEHINPEVLIGCKLKEQCKELYRKALKYRITIIDLINPFMRSPYGFKFCDLSDTYSFHIFDDRRLTTEELCSELGVEYTIRIEAIPKLYLILSNTNLTAV